MSTRDGHGAPRLTGTVPKRHSRWMRTPAQMIALMARETQLHDGPVAHEIGGQPVADNSRAFALGEFVMRTGTGYGFHYRPGHGVACERRTDADPKELELWLHGSVYAAIACLNGLYPLHASAVAWRGSVRAFTGPSGAGKSTLVAGLGQRGIPLFCDDTLLLMLDDPAQIVALPGHKRLKLTETALALTGAEPLAAVGSDTGKSYATPPAGALREPLPLASLTFLSEGAVQHLAPITGAARFAALDDDHYTQNFYLEAQTPTHAALFAVRARLAGSLTMARLVRPLSSEGFAKSLDLAETAIRNFPQEPQP